DSLADSTETDDAQDPAVDIRSQQEICLPALELPFAKEAVGFHYAPRDREEECESEVGSGFGQHARSVRDEDPLASSCRHLDVVVANSVVIHYAHVQCSQHVIVG